MTVEVKTNKSYDVIIESGAVDRVGELIKNTIDLKSKIFIVTDTNVAPLYLKRVIDSLQKVGYKSVNYIIEAGEQSKNLENFGRILNCAAAVGLTRTDCFLALGGGVVGDLCGFCASAFMRGVKFVQVATTFLAAIDSSVGGKTAVNLDEGKNMVGAFHQPSIVIIDTKTLNTLPEIEWKCGLGEAVKYAVLCGGEIYELLNDGIDENNLPRLIELCIKHKAFVVETDEKEQGLRKTLNLGHTIGHAVERISNFSIHHGIAVAMGISQIAKLELMRGILSQSEKQKIDDLIKKYSLLVDFDYKMERIVRAIVFDKKVESTNISIIGINAVGKTYIEKLGLSEFEDLLCKLN